MKSKILLVNFGYTEKANIEKLGFDVDLGYLSDAWNLSGSYDPTKEAPPQNAHFYSELAIYEYKIIFMRLINDPPLSSFFASKAYDLITKKENETFLEYWFINKRILVLFCGKSNFQSLNMLGIPFAYLVNSRGNDRTVSFRLNTEERSLAKSLEELRSLVAIPPAKYIKVPLYKSLSGASKNWPIRRAYTNLTDEDLGIYLNWGYAFDAEDPVVIILPTFHDNSIVFIKLLKSLAKIYPKYLSEITDTEWQSSDKYFPREVAELEKTSQRVIQEAGEKLKTIEDLKKKTKEQYSYLLALLTESGDALKSAVIKTLSEIFKFECEDGDSIRQTDLKEDIVIKYGGNEILGEVKGTRDSNPTFTYISQVLSHLLKSEKRNRIGALILNYDLTKEPESRSPAYTKSDEDEALKEIIFIDTRVLHDLGIAVIDYGMPPDEAAKLLLQKGRVTFNLEEYKKKHD